MAEAPPDYDAIWDHDTMAGYSYVSSFGGPFDAARTMSFEMKVFKRQVGTVDPRPIPDPRLGYIV